MVDELTIIVRKWVYRTVRFLQLLHKQISKAQFCKTNKDSGNGMGVYYIDTLCMNVLRFRALYSNGSHTF